MVCQSLLSMMLSAQSAGCRSLVTNFGDFKGGHYVSNNVHTLDHINRSNFEDFKSGHGGCLPWTVFRRAFGVGADGRGTRHLAHPRTRPAQYRRRSSTSAAWLDSRLAAALEPHTSPEVGSKAERIRFADVSEPCL
jgi:hypothetical protein